MLATGWSAPLNFNTSKVRLEASRRPVPRSPHCISIPQRCDWKDLLQPPTCNGSLKFQYLKGAIGSQARGRGSTPAPQFQYLKGAIGSEHVERFCGHPAPFQYLKGAIGSTPTSGSRKPTSNFNTSKVRLEDFRRKDVRDQCSGFQYLKGAIGRRVGSGSWLAQAAISIPQRCDWKSSSRTARMMSS